MKTRKSITKRFKITKKGKLLRKSIGQNHFLSKKSGKRIRKGRKWIKVSKAEMKRIKKLISF